MKHWIPGLLTLVLLGMTPEKANAQTIDFSKSPEDFFRAHAHQKDTTYTRKPFVWDSFAKRLSLHANMLEWALAVPNIGLELDLDETKMNNRSVSLFAKYRPSTKHDIKPRFMFNLAAVRVEFRKYWRTGKVSNNYYHDEYRLLNVSKPDTLYRKVTVLDEFGEEEVRWEPYFSAKDSLRLGDYDGDTYRSNLYNYYQNLRRRISGRTIASARNWRAYYAGAFVGYDRYAYCFGKRGEQGRIFAVGATAGWSIPLLASAYPRESGLDLDLGVSVGLPFTKWEGFRYVDKAVADYGVSGTKDPYYQAVSNRGSDSWKLNAKYIVQDVHIALVYRFRSIAKKVSLDIVDEYEQKVIQRFKERANSLEEAVNRTLREASERKDSLARVAKVQNDSAEWADYTMKRRLEAMLLLNPDTTQLHGRDSVEYIRLILGKDTADYRRVKEAKVKRARLLEKQAADSAAAAQKLAYRDSLRAAKFQADSLLLQQRVSARDSVRAVKDSLRKVKFEADSIARTKRDLERVRLQAQRDSLLKAVTADRNASKKERQEKKEAEMRLRMEEKAARIQAKEAATAGERAKRDSIAAERDREASLRKAARVASSVLADAEKRNQDLERGAQLAAAKEAREAKEAEKALKAEKAAAAKAAKDAEKAAKAEKAAAEKAAKKAAKKAAENEKKAEEKQPEKAESKNEDEPQQSK